jgi:hypothetical protein
MQRSAISDQRTAANSFVIQSPHRGSVTCARYEPRTRAFFPKAIPSHSKRRCGSSNAFCLTLEHAFAACRSATRCLNVRNNVCGYSTSPSTCVPGWNQALTYRVSIPHASNATKSQTGRKTLLAARRRRRGFVGAGGRLDAPTGSRMD